MLYAPRVLTAWNSATVLDYFALEMYTMWRGEFFNDSFILLPCWIGTRIPTSRILFFLPFFFWSQNDFECAQLQLSSSWKIFKLVIDKRTEGTKEKKREAKKIHWMNLIATKRWKWRGKIRASIGMARMLNGGGDETCSEKNSSATLASRYELRRSQAAFFFSFFVSTRVSSK